MLDNSAKTEVNELSIGIIGEGSTIPKEGEHEFAEGEIVDVKAKPAEDWDFDRWEGEVAETDNKISKVNMDSSKEIAAIFNFEEGDIPGELKFKKMQISPEGDVTNKTELKAEVEIENISDYSVEHDLVLYVNNYTFDKKEIALSPKEKKVVKFTFVPAVADDHALIEIGTLEKFIDLDVPFDNDKDNDREEINIDGDLKVEDGEEKIFEDKKILLEGNLYVNPDATLHIKNSHFQVSQRYKAQRRLVVRKNADFIIENSKFEQKDDQADSPGDDWLHTNLLLRDSGANKINIIDSEFNARMQRVRHDDHIDITPKTKIINSTVSFLTWGTSAEIDIENSDIGRMILTPKGGGEKEELIVEGIRTNRIIDDFSLESKDGGFLDIKKSILHGGLNADFHVSYQGAEVNKRFRFIDCDLDMIQTNIPPTEERIKISDLPEAGHVDKFDISDHIEGLELSYNYTVEESYFSGVKLELWETNALIEDSLAMLHPHTEGVRAIVRNSKLVHHFNYNSKKMQFEDVLFVGNLKFLTPEHTHEDGSFDHSFINSEANLENIVVATTGGNLSGEIEFNNITIQDVSWEKGEITREYPVVVKDSEENPISDVELELYDSNNNKFWSGITNSEGKAYPEIDFDKMNYKNFWSLKSVKNDEKVKDISFLTNTPILIERIR